jgi:Flp pilus assembly protein TadB
MTSTSSLRVGDRERAEAAQRLSAHAAEGRLSVPELESRLERAHAAVVVADLQALEADLPGPERGRRRPPPVAPLVALAVAAVAATVLASLAVGHPVPPLLFLVVALLWRARWRWHPPTWREVRP